MNSGLPNDVRLARAKRENELKDILADTSSFKVFLTSQLGFGPKFGAWTKITQSFGSGNFCLKFLPDFLQRNGAPRFSYFCSEFNFSPFFKIQNPLLLSDEFESELSKLGKSSITELEIAEILFGQAEHIYQEHRNYRKGSNHGWKRRQRVDLSL